MKSEIKGGTQLALTFLNFNEKQRESLSRAVAHYSYKGDGIIDKISSLIYTALENIKFYFESSDWEKAVKAFKEKEVSLIPNFALTLIPDSWIHKTSEIGVQALVKVNRLEIPQPTEDMTRFIEKNLTIDHVAAMVANILEDSLK